MLHTQDEQLTFFIAPNGSDTNSGTIEAPFQTLEGARDALREFRQAKEVTSRTTVYLRAGTYLRTESFHLEAEDAGEPGREITYTAYRDEEVMVIGGTVLQGEDFSPVTDERVRTRFRPEVRDAIRQIDLSAYGVTDFGRLEQGGFGPFDYAAQPELFFNDRALDVSRYPRTGYLLTGEITEAGGSPRGDGPDAPSDDVIAEAFKHGHTFKYDDPRPNEWKNTGDIWLQGYFYHDYADGNLNVAEINPATQEISTKTASWYGIRSGQRYYYYNVLEETTHPGDWYLDRTTGMLYLYPPADLASADIVLSLLNDPLFLLDETSHIMIASLTLGYTRGTAVQILGGSHNQVAGCVIRQTGEFGVTVGERTTGENAGHNHCILSCDVSETGIGGIYLAGGERESLTPGENVAKNNDLFAFSRIRRTYSPAIALAGVGNRVVHNYMHDAPHQAVAISGNDHVIEYNEIYNVLTETGDSGAIYMGRNWSSQGNVIRYNYLHRLGNEASFDQVGIYLDDMASGTTMYGNIFRAVYRAFLIGGGRSNTVEKNVIIDGTESLFLDNRAMNWASASVVPGGVMDQTLGAMPYQTEPWATAYPELVSILADEPAVPKYNVVRANTIYKTNDPVIDEHVTTYGTVEANVVTEDADYVAQQLDTLPREVIGLYKDRYRTHVTQCATTINL